MRHPLDDLISAKIQEAEANGEFQNLSGAGKPLPTLDNPADTYFGRVMRENGAAPEFVVLSKQLQAKRMDLRDCDEPSVRRELQQEVSTLEARVAFAKDAWRK